MADLPPDPRFKYIPFGTDHPIFHGVDGVEAEEWVCAVRQKALSLQKQRDNDWIADFASTCFVGDALRWYEDLDENVQRDWRKLRLALLTQWPAPSHRDQAAPPNPQTQSAIIPTPAAAPPANTDGARIGRIRIVAAQNLSGVTVFSGYISRTINAFGCHVATKDLAEALVVRVESEGAGPSRLKMENSSSKLRWLGVSWAFPQPDMGTGSTQFGYVAAVAENDDNSSCGKHGVLRSAIWNVDPDTNRTLRAIWAGPGHLPFDLAAVYNTDHKLVDLVGQSNSFRNANAGWLAATLEWDEI